MKLDFFDVSSLCVATLLLGAAVILGLKAKTSGSASMVLLTPLDDAARPEVAHAKALQQSGRIEESIALLKSVIHRIPGAAEPHFLLGRAFCEMQDFPAALKEFRMTLALDPDFADPKSPKYAGEEIKAGARLGLSHTRTELAKTPENPVEKAAQEDAFFLERMLAGGCG